MLEASVLGGSLGLILELDLGHPAGALGLEPALQLLELSSGDAVAVPLPGQAVGLELAPEEAAQGLGVGPEHRGDVAGRETLDLGLGDLDLGLGVLDGGGLLHGILPSVWGVSPPLITSSYQTQSPVYTEVNLIGPASFRAADPGSSF